MTENVKKKFLPPDGGWGWAIVGGHALSYFFLLPMLQNFTLLYKDRFFDLNFSSTDISTLITLNASFGMILGVLNGPFLKIFGYRKLALVGGTLYVLGIFCTGIANSLVEFIIYYGMISSLGMIMTMAAQSLAINSFFFKKRSKAVGYSMVITSFGSVIMPLVVSELLSSYGVKWTVFLISALNLHVYVAALLLQPIKWHLKPIVPDKLISEEEKEEEEKEMFLPQVNSFSDISFNECQPLYKSNSTNKFWSQNSLSNYSKNFLQSSIKQNKDKWEKQKQSSIMYLDNEDYKSMMNSTLYMMENFGTSDKLAKYASVETLSVKDSESLLEYEMDKDLKPKILETVKEEETEVGCIKRSLHFLKDIYDLDLLVDPIFLNTLLGLSIAIVGEIVFSSMTPLIFAGMGYSTEECSVFMAVIAGSDLIFRFIAPFVAKKMRLGSKMMYLFALILLLLSRFCMFLANTYTEFLFVSFALGIGKGFRSVFWVLVIPDSVPLSKLPSASAFQSLSNGIFLLISGPLMGAVIGINNKYSNVIIASNILTLTTVILWGGELIFLKYLKSKREKSNVGNM